MFQLALLPLLICAAVGDVGKKPFCELYAAGHFGNWYEVAGEREMRAVLVEAKRWGFNRYGDWFDTLDCVNPFSGDPQYSLGNALWDRKRIHFRTAQSLGLGTDLVTCPNHVYRDQLKPEWLAKGGPRIQGQLICPSIPEARQRILQNHRELLADLAKAGVRLTAITLAPYDYGGCGCDKCKPWITTFAKLSCDIYAIAREYHPQIEMHFVGWWWTAEEHKLFAEWMDQNAPNIARSISLHIPYGNTGVSDVPLPKGCERFAFVHIGYAEQASPRDVYGMLGPVIAAKRLEATVRDLRKQGVTGVVAYSEGIFDDLNKALLAGMWSGQFNTPEQVLRDYAVHYFNATPEQAAKWSDWLLAWGKPFVVDAAAAKRSFGGLTGDPLDWRRRQWEMKADMFVANQAIGAGTSWPADRIAKAEAFFAAQETLQRSVYGLAPQRHIFAPRFLSLPWAKSWWAHQQVTASQAQSEQ